MKQHHFPLSAIALAMTSLCQVVHSADLKSLEAVVVTATPMSSALVVETDPSIARQPLPAHDGADYLKTIPGFSVMRKGGTDGEPIFRGMAGSRLNILVDGQPLAGACPSRMDAPTAYVFPEAYDRLTVIKGPQTVLYPYSGSAATIRFDREPRVYVAPASSFSASALTGSFGRHDEIIKAETGSPTWYAQANANNSASGDYEDGNGQRVHSRYRRWSTNAAVGLTPDKDTRIELSATTSDGYAAYADRMMDGSRFRRENFLLKAERHALSPVLSKLSFQLGHNSIDHVMDNYSLRTPIGMRMSSRVDLVSTQAGLHADLALAQGLTAKVGTSYTLSQHSKDSMSSGVLADDARFSSFGLFGELSKDLGPATRSISGLRMDVWRVDDQRADGASSTAGQSRSERTYSAFTRIEHAMGPTILTYAGFGYAQRFPDYWELIAMSSSRASVATASAMQSVRKEKNHQIDAGMLMRTDSAELSASVFYSRVDDFILVNYNGIMPMGGIIGVASNVDAQTHGMELGAKYKLSERLRLTGSLATVHGRDLSNDRPLAQLPPLEASLGLNYQQPRWHAGGVLRMVAAKDSVNPGYGSIAGKDLGPTSGFATVSLNAGYRPTRNSLVLVGVDNLFDRNYAEFISRTGNTSIAGYVPTMRVNEPGRILWLKASLLFE